MEAMIKVNEIFDSFQGEGILCGFPATFLRTSGCNLKCPWCDTDHENGKLYTPKQLAEAIVECRQLLVITGGEPTLQPLDDFLDKLRPRNIFIAVETNGTKPDVLEKWKGEGLVNHITVSPKANMLNDEIRRSLVVADEIKVVMDEQARPEIYSPYISHLFEGRAAFIQPCSMAFGPAVKYVMEHEGWRLGVQLHKVVGAR